MNFTGGGALTEFINDDNVGALEDVKIKFLFTRMVAANGRDMDPWLEPARLDQGRLAGGGGDD